MRKWIYFLKRKKWFLLFPCLEKVVRRETMTDYFPSLLLLEENRNCLYLQQIFMLDIKKLFFLSFLVKLWYSSYLERLCSLFHWMCLSG